MSVAKASPLVDIDSLRQGLLPSPPRIKSLFQADWGYFAWVWVIPVIIVLCGLFYIAQDTTSLPTSLSQSSDDWDLGLFEGIGPVQEFPASKMYG
jgi:hypothetical protein